MSEKTNTNALDQFVQAAKLLNDPESVVDLIKKVIDSPSVYSFSELLEIPLIKSIQHNENYKIYYELLKLFSYGTYLDYVGNSSYPKLSAGAEMKLRHLSIVSLASKCRTIPYKILCDQLRVSNIRELEDLIIEAFYADIIKGKLDQLNNQLEIDFAIGRDVTDEKIDEILLCLDSWCKNCEIALKTIEAEISNANMYKQKQLEIQNNIENEVSNLKKSIKIQNQEVESMNLSKDSGKKSGKVKGFRLSGNAKSK